MTRKPKKSTKRPEIEKITLNVIHLFSIYKRKIRHFSNPIVLSHPFFPTP